MNKINLKKILKNKEIIKKLSIDNTINYSLKKFSNGLIKSYSYETSLAYGRLIFSNKIFILGGDVSCKGDSLLTEEYPRLNFTCILNLKDKKKLFKKFSLTQVTNSKPIDLNIEGSLNLFNRKINFKRINIGNSYTANEDDKKYFKEVFENTLFDGGFFGIFRIDKFKNFLQAVI